MTHSKEWSHSEEGSDSSESHEMGHHRSGSQEDSRSHEGSHSHGGSHSHEGSHSRGGSRSGEHAGLRQGHGSSEEEECWLSEDGWNALYIALIMAVIITTIVLIVMLVRRRRKRCGKAVLRLPTKSQNLGPVVITPGSQMYGVTNSGMKGDNEHYVVVKDTAKILPTQPSVI